MRALARRHDPNHIDREAIQMAKKRAICPTLLRQLIEYNPETGKMRWKPRSIAWFAHHGKRAVAIHGAWTGQWAGKPALTYVSTDGYFRGRLFDTDLRAHRVAFAIMTGRYPETVDHINGDRADNRWSNLREANRQQNSTNVFSHRGSSSKFRGVCWDKRSAKWKARINVNHKVHELGSFVDELAAARAYDAVAPMLHGEFAKLNFRAETV